MVRTKARDVPGGEDLCDRRHRRLVIRGAVERHHHRDVADIEIHIGCGDHLAIPLDKPADRTAPDGQTYSYGANDASVGDLDGDGRYELIVKWYPSIAKDNAFSGYTG